MLNPTREKGMKTVVHGIEEQKDWDEKVREAEAVLAENEQRKQQAREQEEARELQVQAEEHSRRQKAVRDRFEQLIHEGTEQRARFENLFRETCLAFGAYCETLAELSGLANALITHAGPLPDDRRRLAELSAMPQPLPILFDAGYETTKEFGWNWSLPVVALRKRG